jgi:hypothetical protein
MYKTRQTHSSGVRLATLLVPAIFLRTTLLAAAAFVRRHLVEILGRFDGAKWAQLDLSLVLAGALLLLAAILFLLTFLD